jgi:hypothetical protein
MKRPFQIGFFARLFRLACLLLAPACLFSEVQAAQLAVVKASVVVKVSDREAAVEKLVAKLESLGGYFSTLDDQQLVGKVPAAAAQDYLHYAESLGVVVERGFDSVDVTQQLDQLRSRLRAREAMIDKYYGVLKAAETGGVLSVEREVSSLVREVEQLRGQLNLLEHQLAYSEVTVLFQFRDRSAPQRDGRSSFAWLNTVNLQDLLEDFRNEP